MRAMAMGGQTTGAAINAPIVSRHGSMSIFSKPDPAAFLPRAQDEPDTFGEVTPSLPTLLHDETLTSDGDLIFVIPQIEGLSCLK